MDVSFPQETLKEYIRTHPHKGFKPKPIMNKTGNMIVWYFSDDDGYAETVQVDGVAVGHLIRSFKTNEVVGVKIFLESVKDAVK